jgi:hypothetical protein
VLNMFMLLKMQRLHSMQLKSSSEMAFKTKSP